MPVTVPCGRTCNSSVRSCSRVGPGHPIDVSSLGGGAGVSPDIEGLDSVQVDVYSISSYKWNPTRAQDKRGGS